MREKFAFDVSASRAKRVLLNSQRNIKGLKKEAHRRVRRAWQ